MRISMGNTASLFAANNALKISRRSNALSEDYIARIQAFAQRDAKSGVYMSAGYIAMEKAYMAANISPDRAGAMAKVNAKLKQPGPPEEHFDWFCEMLDIPYEVDVQRGMRGNYAQIYNENGEMIAAYSPLSGWTTVPTKAEELFSQTSTNIYYTAYQAARAANTATEPQPQGFSLSV